MFIQLKKDYFGQKAGARIDVDEPVAQTLLTQGIAEAVQGDPLAPIIARSMETMLASLTASLDDTLKQFAAAQAKSRKNALPAIFGPGGSGDPDHTFGRFLLAVRQRDLKALDQMGSRFADWDHVGHKAAMAGQTGTTGGYTVPGDFLPRLFAIASESSVVEPRATVIPMATDTIEVPTLDVTTAPSAGDTAFFGGLNHRDRAGLQGPDADRPRADRLHARLQQPARRQRGGPGSGADGTLRPGARLVQGLRLPARQRRGQAARCAQRQRPDFGDALGRQRLHAGRRRRHARPPDARLVAGQHRLGDPPDGDRQAVHDDRQHRHQRQRRLPRQRPAAADDDAVRHPHRGQREAAGAGHARRRAALGPAALPGRRP
ncbi:MAG: phage major capsid protein, partial [Chloroflexi bacterium]